MGIPSPGGGTRQQAGGRRQGRVIPFGKYLLLERIAVGGMAEVYMAKSFGIEGFEKILAIKRILPTMAEDEDFIEMFIDEAKIAGQLNHANIAPIFELGKIGDSHYIAMEYVWGKDLLQIMNRFRRLRKRMPPAMVAWIATKMCEALDYAHNKRDRRGTPLNIIHRDVSPQNILLSPEGLAKLSDFGIAKDVAEPITDTGLGLGTLAYVAPEQAFEAKAVDPHTDTYSLGATLYHLLTGSLPLPMPPGLGLNARLERLKNEDPKPLSAHREDVPAPIADALQRMLSKAPDARGPVGEGLAAVLRGLREQHYPRSGSWPDLSKSTRRLPRIRMTEEGATEL